MLPTADQTPNNESADRTVPSPIEDLPSPVTVLDRLHTIYRSSGPYTSVYLHLDDTVNGRFDRRVLAMIDELRRQGASEAAIGAIEARIALPRPEETAGIGVIAADDGTTIVDYGLEPPAQDYGVVDTLPYVAPLLEWHQHRVAHVVLTVDEQGADLAIFGLDHLSRVEHLDAERDRIEARTAEVCAALAIELLIVTGEPDRTAAIADTLVPMLDVRCRVVVEPPHDDLDELVDATVRLVNDAAARRTVGFLREHRFLDEHDAAVDGRESTVAELVNGSATQLLIHDSWIDQERLWVGAEPNELSMTERPDYRSARLVDALLWSAVLQGVPVAIIPSTGPDGPAEDTGAIVDDRPQSSS